MRKREAETISRDEHQELSVLTDALEEYNVRRMNCVSDVAKRHGVGLRELMDELGIKPRELD